MHAFHRGKKGARNYTFDIVLFALERILKDESERDLIEGHLEAKSLDPELINWAGAP